TTALIASMTRCRSHGPSRSIRLPPRSHGSIRTDRRGTFSRRAWATRNACQTATHSSASHLSAASSKSPRTERSSGSTSVRSLVGRFSPDRTTHRATSSFGPYGTAPRSSRRPRLRPDERNTRRENDHAAGDHPDRRTPVIAQRNLGTDGGQSLRKHLRARCANADRRPPRACRARHGYAAVPPPRAQARRALADGLGRAARALLRKPRRRPPRRAQLAPRSPPLPRP